MSTAGIRSNRGDIYQTLVAFDWALTVLSDPDFEWIEIDSTTHGVDDVVVGKSGGATICCQCKKNQIDSKAWTIVDLADELEKAASLLATDPGAEVRFVSRSPFGALGKLREHSTTQPNEASYYASLSKEHQATDTDLAARLAAKAGNLSTYHFLCRTHFEISPELDRMEALLRERLRQLASNPKVAFDALWTKLDQLGGRMEGNGASAANLHRLAKDDLKAVLHHAGSMLVPVMALVEVRASFASTSAIGRSWQREIAGHRLPSPVLSELLDAIDSGSRSILLTGLPGSGKTCVMLALQEKLEESAQTNTDLVPLFIQSREFADFSTAQDRQAQGLPEQWVEKAARMAEESRVIVVIDSLDVLSIAREHSVLTYFLGQIDRLSLIPNVTVVTSCRDFDRHYDRRVAERQWECELKCRPLSWNKEIAPLLDSLGIQTAAIDAVTRELIKNPRELALFVELALQEGSFNVVTSQALAQRYLDTIVRGNPALGEAAMQAIEGIADEMLKTRSLAVPLQRYTASQDTQRVLCSHNVLQKTQDGKLTFGHQTLLDVLVISGALRRGITLSQFIQDLPPVPFVRPSIRSFVAQLAIGERKKFRGQLRTVLTGSSAFHVRRLVAESFAEQIPFDEDWPLLRDLRDKHGDVFQVIYTQATKIEWHHFWIKHLIPVLQAAQDIEGLTRHMHRVAQWKNEDSEGVLRFWLELLTTSGFDNQQFATQLPFYLSEIAEEKQSLVAPLLKLLLDLPRPDHGFLGIAIARCVLAGAASDSLLWQYVVNQISDDDVLGYHFGNKLHCRPHEFGNGNEDFLRQQMEKSTMLLNLAVCSIEQWSHLRIQRKGSWMAGSSGFLRETSYNDAHSQTDHRHIDSERVLLDAIEASILNHTKKNSEWWQDNRERLSFSHEGALRYFALRACIAAPLPNLDLIGRMLRDNGVLESELSYEFGTLIQEAFIYLNEVTQDAVTQSILSLRAEEIADERDRPWVLKSRAEFISTIPCQLRSFEAQAVLLAYENTEGVLFRQPFIGMRGGWVSAPFSFEVFLTASDSGVLRLLAHYSGHRKESTDFLVGGEEQVGGQLREAASRQPSRFLRLLTNCWADISEMFRDEIMDGVANYLSHCHGNLQANGAWVPLEGPDAQSLAGDLLDELERHPNHWRLSRAASNALQACSHVIRDTNNAERVAFLAIDFTNIREESPIKGDSVDLITAGINMTSGHVAEAVMILANGLWEHGIQFPSLLPCVLRRLARNEHPAIRALMLRRLPYLQSRSPELGWELFNLCMEEASGQWENAEHCLYYTYRDHFEKVAPFLERLRNEGEGKELEVWGRISALVALSGRLNFADWIEELKTLDSTDAWSGAASVWTHTENIKQHRNQCVAGIEAGLSADSSHAVAVAGRVEDLFRDDESLICIPIPLIRSCFDAFELDNENKHHRLFGFEKWLNATSCSDPEQALAIAELYLAYVSRTKPYLYDHENSLTQLMTRLFAEAEEREESDQGAMLHRVVVVQDMLLSLGVNSLNDWLKAAERQ